MPSPCALRTSCSTANREEKFEAFGEKLMPILAEVGIQPGAPEILEVHKIVKR